MKIKIKVIEFKTVSPLFEMERDGIKPFTTRLVDYHDCRFRALAQWHPDRLYDPQKIGWLIKITNPATGEYFYRELIDKLYMPKPDFFIPESDYRAIYRRLQKWLILYLGKEIKEE